MSKPYQPEEYWSEVAARIKGRDGENVVAGDDEPYYRYKRQRLLNWIRGINFRGKSVLEVGSGPGGNLREIYRQEPSRLAGADVSGPMVELARKHCPRDVEIHKIDGTSLPFGNREFDIVFTVTVLQHNTNEGMLKKIIAEIARVSNERVFMFERVDPTIEGDELCLGRPASYYSALMSQYGFSLVSKEHINIRASYYMAGAIRKGLNPGSRQEGEALNGVSTFLQNMLLPVTRLLDKVFHSNHDLAKLEFARNQA